MKVCPPSCRSLILQPAGIWPPVARVGEAASPVLEAGPGRRRAFDPPPVGVDTWGEAAVEAFLGLGVLGFEFLGDGEGLGGTFFIWFAPYVTK